MSTLTYSAIISERSSVGRASRDVTNARPKFEVRGLITNPEQGVRVGNIFYGTEGILALTSYETEKKVLPLGASYLGPSDAGSGCQSDVHIPREWGLLAFILPNMDQRNAFNALLEQWRDEGSMEGLEIDRAV